ncbi:type I restriction-modification system subunit M [Aerococcus urinaeequi]|uniref:type I restriction-modification system subunit M n=1 Tax=Aerococcus urinaeequi TaxID=51665 RepID=UPI003D6A93C0
MITSEEIKSRLWDGANELRGSMDASQYKDYMLGLMFYKFLSDKTLENFRTVAGLGQISEEELLEQYTSAYSELGEALIDTIQSILGYYILPEHLYQNWIKDINSGHFELQKVTDSLHSFERSVSVSGDSESFKGLFSGSTLDLTNTALGQDLNARSNNVKSLIMLFADLNMVALQEGDVLGDAYEYLIGKFAMESGKKAGEFYTPRQVSQIMAKIVAKTSNIETIYDPTVGSGSLLLTVGEQLDENAQKRLTYYGQEKNTATYNLTRMNLLLHGVRPEKMSIKNGDTLSEDWPENPDRPNEGVQFDAVVMNPPYSVKNWNKSELKVSDPRFEVAGVLPPDSKGDYAFLLHGLYHLGQQGTMAIVLPHGILFRGGAEGEIRKRLVDKNYIDTIIGLPSNLFTNTGIPVVIMVLKKDRALDAPILFIDASNDFIKVGKQNVLEEKDIAKIVDTYSERVSVEGYSHIASREVIIANEYNLNIPRFVEVTSTSIPHDANAHLHGGIPLENIEDLGLLRSLVPNILEDASKDIREGYVELTQSVEDISKTVFNDERVLYVEEQISDEVKAYIEKYWHILRNVNNPSELSDVKNDMLQDFKQILSSYDHLDVYDGYQIIANMWSEYLKHDTELISKSDFYTLGRTREPNWVTKGTGNKKRIEQDGWVGSLVPNEIILQTLYMAELAKLEDLKVVVADVENELFELAEAANVEDSVEESVLSDTLNEAGDALESKKVKQELKNVVKDSEEYQILKRVEKLFSDKSKLNKDIKAGEKALKEAVEQRITELTDEEIDLLMHKKWFSALENTVQNLVQQPLKEELHTLKLLQERYSKTLAKIDEDISESYSLLKDLMKDLVIIK